MTARSVLAVAVASGRAGYVYLSDGQLCDWGITVKATNDAADMAGFLQGLINDLEPEVVVTEKRNVDSRKGDRSLQLIKLISEISSHNAVYDVSVPRPRRFPSKYEEAAHLAGRHPDVAGYLPKRKRRIFDFEPRNMIIFEALALAEEVISDPTDVPNRAPQ